MIQKHFTFLLCLSTTGQSAASDSNLLFLFDLSLHHDHGSCEFAADPTQRTC